MLLLPALKVELDKDLGATIMAVIFIISNYSLENRDEYRWRLFEYWLLGGCT